MSSLIRSNVLNYQEELIGQFDQFLQTSGASLKTRRNYISDIRHFFSWLLSTFQKLTTTIHAPTDLVLAVDRLTVLMYKRSLWESQTPIATINRRLSSLRSFFTHFNPGDESRISPTEALENYEKNAAAIGRNDRLIMSFLQTKGVDIPTDLRLKQAVYIDEFLSWLNKRK